MTTLVKELDILDLLHIQSILYLLIIAVMKGWITPLKNERATGGNSQEFWLYSSRLYKSLDILSKVISVRNACKYSEFHACGPDIVRCYGYVKRSSANQRARSGCRQGQLTSLWLEWWIYLPRTKGSFSICGRNKRTRTGKSSSTQSLKSTTSKLWQIEWQTSPHTRSKTKSFISTQTPQKNLFLNSRKTSCVISFEQ